MKQSDEVSEDFLLLSGIQHMAFCERQWALIHIEQVWAENVRTVEGKQLHERADEKFCDTTRKDIRVVRGMPVLSKALGLRGVADVVEFYCVAEEGGVDICRIHGRQGWWRVAPVEYKRGKPKKDDRDAVQLCAQAMALEEMLDIVIKEGFLFYGQTRHRQRIVFDEPLRQHTRELAQRMRKLLEDGTTPKASKGKRCSQCSLVEQCQPEWMLKHRSVARYLERMCQLEEEERCDAF